MPSFLRIGAGPHPEYYPSAREIISSRRNRLPACQRVLKVHKNEKFSGSDFEFCSISLFHFITMSLTNSSNVNP
jgi:hypothetical protein